MLCVLLSGKVTFLQHENTITQVDKLWRCCFIFDFFLNEISMVMSVLFSQAELDPASFKSKLNLDHSSLMARRSLRCSSSSISNIPPHSRLARARHQVNITSRHEAHSGHILWILFMSSLSPMLPLISCYCTHLFPQTQRIHAKTLEGHTSYEWRASQPVCAHCSSFLSISSPL